MNAPTRFERQLKRGSRNAAAHLPAEVNGRKHRWSHWAVVFGWITLQPAQTSEPTRATDDDLRIRGVFESALPGTERKNSVRLIVHPHFGDLRAKEHLRTAVGLRCGLTKNWEATAESDWYLSHGLKSVSFCSETGFSSVHVGSKYRIGELRAGGWDYSVGTDFVRPVGTPPSSVTDGLQHISPYVTFSRAMARWPEWRVFCGLGYDFVVATSIAGELSKNQLTDDSVSVSGGFLWSRGPMTYTFEGNYATMHATVDSTRDIVTLRPGIVWVLPPRFTFGSRGKWLAGFALRVSHGVDGNDFGASAKLRVNFDFRRLIFGRKTETLGAR